MKDFPLTPFAITIVLPGCHQNDRSYYRLDSPM